MPGPESRRTDRGDPQEVDFGRPDPGFLVPLEPQRPPLLRALLAGAAWRFPAALEEMRLWAHPNGPRPSDPNHAFYRPGDVVDECGDGGPVEPPEERVLPPH